MCPRNLESAHTVIHDAMTVVAHQGDDCVGPEPHLSNIIEKDADVSVAVGHLARVGGKSELELPLTELVGAFDCRNDSEALI